MIQLIISNRQVYLPESLNFTFLYENPYFTSNSNSTYNIELPLKGCPDNLRIFGHLHRLWSKKSKISYPALLICDASVKLRGTAVVNEVTEKSVKIQLLSGNSEFNFRTNDDSYINKLDLGKVKFPTPTSSTAPMDASRKWEYYGNVDQVDAVWNPVKYGDEYYNRIILQTGSDKFYSHMFRDKVCVQPYLVFVIRKIVEYYGYTIGINDIDNSFLRNLYIVSALRTENIAQTLPKWTLSEFLDELEKFCAVITVVDEATKVVNFISLADYYDDSDPIVISSDDVLEEYQVTINNSTSDKDIATGNVSYNLPSLDENKYLKVEDDIVSMALHHTVNTYEQVGLFFNSLSETDKFKYIVTAGGRQYICYKSGDTISIKEVNVFRDLIRNQESTTDVTLKIVPAAIELYNTPVYLLFNDAKMDVAPDRYLPLQVPVTSYYREMQSDEINIQEAIEGTSEVDSPDEGKDILEVAFSDGLKTVEYTYGETITTDFQYPCPYTDNRQTVPGLSGGFSNYSLSLYSNGSYSIGYRFARINTISSDISYKISFKCKKSLVLDPKKVFIIANQKYHCEKLEVQVSIDGFSEIVEGVFYRVE